MVALTMPWPNFCRVWGGAGSAPSKYAPDLAKVTENFTLQSTPS